MFDNLFWALYWIDVLSGLPSTLLFAAFLAVASGFGAMMLTAIFRGEFNDERVSKQTAKTSLITCLLAFVLTLASGFIPNRQTMYMMLGVKATKNFTETDMGKKLQEYINEQMDSFLKKKAS